MNVRRDAVLREMGLAPLWRLRTSATSAVHANPGGEASEAAYPESSELAHSDPKTTSSPTRVLAPASGVVRALPFAAAPVRPGDEHAPAAATSGGVAYAMDDADRAGRIARLDWDELESDIRTCTACSLCEQRKQAVPGVGDRRAPWMFVGEGPGAEEDRVGEPFVGPAGRLLDAMLHAIGLSRGEGVYIANAVKCRPPLNRTPQESEIITCRPYLERQIALIRPRVLVALGRPAAQALTGMEVRINAARGKTFVHSHEGTRASPDARLEASRIPVVVTYHPAYLLRNQLDKAKAWEDLCFARRVMADQPPD